jgi:hypothetical protein
VRLCAISKLIHSGLFSFQMTMTYDIPLKCKAPGISILRSSNFREKRRVHLSSLLIISRHSLVTMTRQANTCEFCTATIQSGSFPSFIID